MLVVADGEIQRRSATVISRDPARGVVAINGSIQQGDTVIVAPTASFVEGTRVRTTGASGPTDITE